MVTQPLSTLPTLQPAPEDERRTTAIAELDEFLTDEGTIRPDLLGGLLPADLDIEELKNTNMDILRERDELKEELISVLETASCQY